jgi:hypothetical protein
MTEEEQEQLFEAWDHVLLDWDGDKPKIDERYREVTRSELRRMLVDTANEWDALEILEDEKQTLKAGTQLLDQLQTDKEFDDLLSEYFQGYEWLATQTDEDLEKAFKRWEASL